MRTNKLLTVILALGLLAAALTPGLALAGEKTFNDYVIEVMESYPTDGSYPYEWTNDYAGITKDLYYQGELFVKGDARNRSYCSGITFEVFFQAYMNYAKDHGLDSIANMDIDELEQFRRKWYGVGGDRRTIKHALESTNMGYEIEDKSEVKKGDFVQIWRHSGSGHTVIFIDWVKDASGKITGFKYWSSNYGRGLSYRTEFFGKYGKYIKEEETYFMRVIEPTEWFAKYGDE